MIMIKIIKEYPLQYNVECEECGKKTFINKRYYEKWGWNKHDCLKKMVPVIKKKNK